MRPHVVTIAVQSRTGILRGGTIYICPDNFRATDAGDLMYENDVSVTAPADSYPWVSKRDLNTLGTAYCN